MASLIDYYLRLVGADKPKDQPQQVEAVSISGTEQAPAAPTIKSDLETPSMGAVQNQPSYAMADTAASGASKSSSQFGKSGMTNAQAGMMIGRALGDAFTKANTSPTVSLPQSSSVQPMNFRFPTVTYQGGR